MTDTVFIYALNCPITGQTRYVGKTVNPERRFQEHLREKSNNHRANWIKFLRACGQKPLLELLDEVPSFEWPQWEVAYIQHFREQGFDLVNGTPGGEGCLEHSTEALAKMSAARIGEKNPLFGKHHSLETRAKMSAAQSGENHYLFGKHPSEIVRAILSKAHQGKKASLETKLKMSASQKERRAKEKLCQTNKT